MQEKFEQIKKEFDEHDRSLRKNFRLIVRDTEKGIWGPADLETCFELFKQIGLEKASSFIDLGSGDGRIVLVASLFTKAAGIEIDEDLIKVGLRTRDKLGSKADLVKGDFFKVDLSQYDVLFINPDTGFYNGLEDKLLKEMKPGARLYVYNNIFLPRFLEEEKSFGLGLAPVIVYRNC